MYKMIHKIPLFNKQEPIRKKAVLKLRKIAIIDDSVDFIYLQLIIKACFDLNTLIRKYLLILIEPLGVQLK